MIRQVRRFSTVKLVYDLHKPPAASSPKTDAPIIILHGLFGNKVNNRTPAKALAKALGTNVYCVDQRNHGQSPHAKPHTYQAMSEDLDRFISDHGLQRPVLIGHSMGAKTVMTHALAYPDRSRGIVPVENAPISKTIGSEMHTYCMLMKEIDSMEFSSRKEASEYLSDTVSSPSLVHFLLTNASMVHGVLKFHIPLDILRDSLNSVGLFDYSIYDRPLKTYTNPSLFVKGSDSPYITATALNREIPILFPNYKIETLQGGHWIIAEQPAAFCKLVEKFVLSL
ncbi:hypothetical protein CANCADRAFT_30670 [Tortispora caseinolytica NRRL Y-17796]|uniref:AB hydrolase-1 domain-containing protein n=1 Tax=Tortispora caseinolytica NRRL Y-17796 TaxID=767744 RepID=A0A1E4TL99_9ASCO|nr:hypothetical protein CANCADRAFT_30670 [Tortispora caseinolytica NRRL Y-17796]